MSFLIYCECPNRNSYRHRIIAGKISNTLATLLKKGEGRGHGHSGSLMICHPSKTHISLEKKNLFCKIIHLLEIVVFGKGSGHSLSASLCPGLGADSAGGNKQPCCIISTWKTVTGNTPASGARLESYSISYPGGDQPKGMIRISLNSH